MRSALFNILFYAFSLVIAVTLWVMTKISTRDRMWDLLGFWGRSVLWLIRVILGGQIEVRGREHLKPEQSQLIVSKHQSELDIVMLAVLFRHISAVAMAELTRYPFFGSFLRALDIILVAVDSGPQGRTEQVMAGGKRIASEGRTMVIYPEGELMKLGAKERYRHGAYHLYAAMGVEAVPVAVSMGVIWPRRDWTKRTGQRGVIEYLEPIQPGLDRDTFMAEVEQRIETRTMELIRECAPPAVLAEAEARHSRGATNHD